MPTDFTRIEAIENSQRKLINIIEVFAARIEAFDNKLDKLAAWTKELSDVSQKTNSEIVSLLKNSSETHSSIAELADVITKSVAASVSDEVSVAQSAGQFRELKEDLLLIREQLETLSFRLDTVEGESET